MQNFGLFIMNTFSRIIADTLQECKLKSCTVVDREILPFDCCNVVRLKGGARVAKVVKCVAAAAATSLCNCPNSASNVASI